MALRRKMGRKRLRTAVAILILFMACNTFIRSGLPSVLWEIMRAEGIYPIVREGYRTAEEQQRILDDKIYAYVKEGYSRKRAEKLAKAWVAIPGTSEHQLGIAVDINADQPKSSNEEVYIWLAENAHRYGFILRYPQQKENITGTSYEPWHYRYVGKEVAEKTYTEHICLEEYMENALINGCFNNID